MHHVIWQTAVFLVKTCKLLDLDSVTVSKQPTPFAQYSSIDCDCPFDLPLAHELLRSTLPFVCHSHTRNSDQDIVRFLLNKGIYITKVLVSVI